MKKQVIAILLTVAAVTCTFCPMAAARKTNVAKGTGTLIADKAKQDKYDYFFVESVVQRENGNIDA